MEDQESPDTPTSQRDASHDGMQLPLYNKPLPTAAQPPLALLEDRVRAQNGRQLGCARVSSFLERCLLPFQPFPGAEMNRREPVPVAESGKRRIV